MHIFSSVLNLIYGVLSYKELLNGVLIFFFKGKLQYHRGMNRLVHLNQLSHFSPGFLPCRESGWEVIALLIAVYENWSTVG